MNESQGLVWDTKGARERERDRVLGWSMKARARYESEIREGAKVLG